MFKIVMDLLAHKQLQFEEGSIKLLGQNVVIFPFDNLFSIQKIIEDGNKTQELYLASKELGKNWIKNLFKFYKMDTIQEQAHWGERVFTLAGMGKMKVVTWNTKDSTTIYRAYESTTAKYYGNVDRPVCHIPRGWFAGASSTFFNKDLDGMEVKCMSKGDKYCEFFIGPKELVDSMAAAKR
ncbi:MAG: hypothetical protein HY051_00500 [Candidatus Aenigmarchaeota archaeon]|nr:hypothetical protein [Candidatus Aenigmarchaeota archaeon]